jgi:hypothetical protein
VLSVKARRLGEKQGRRFVIIADLLGARVFGPDFVGFVTDARFSLDTVSTGRRARL